MSPLEPQGHETIDWQDVRARLARATMKTEQALQLSPERGQEVMDARALLLAQTPAGEAQTVATFEVIVFTLANERYAIETCHVREVIRFSDFTPLPGAPEFLVGVTNLRGHILAVVDLRKFFGVAARGLTDLSRVLVLGH